MEFPRLSYARGVILRRVAHEFPGVADVPGAAGVIGDSEKDGELHLGTNRFRDELGEIAGTAPFVSGLRIAAEERTVIGLKKADANADDMQAVDVRVMAAEGFAKNFGAAVNGGGTNRHLRSNRFAFRIVENGLAGAGKKELRHAGLACRFESVVPAREVY